MAKNGNDWRSGSPRRGRSATKPTPAESSPQAKEKSDWRKKKLGNEDKARDQATKGKDYLRRRDQTQREKKARHRVKLGLWTGAILILVAVFIAIIVFMPQRVTMVRIVVTDYQAPLPPNAYALEDSNLLNEMEAGNSGNIIIQRDMDEVRPKGEFLPQLRKTLLQVKPGGPGKKTYIIYVSAHGVVNEANEPCLMLSGADALDSNNWLPIEDMFKEMGEVPALQDPEIIKLVILDSGRINHLWDSGILYNGFPDALQRTVENSDLKNLFVLHSCSPGERNWSGPELNGSAFGHYVARGLNGAADLNEDKTVALNELYIYVRMRVNQWADLHRGARQNPRLIPEVDLAKKIPLTYRNSSVKQLPAAVDERPSENSQKLTELWIQHEQLLTDAAPYRHDPVAWAEVQEGLIRLESLLLAGTAYNDDFESLAGRLANKMNVLAAYQPLTEIGPINLPLSRQLHGYSPDPAAIRDLQARMRDEVAGIPPNPEIGPPPAPKSYLEAAHAAWDWVRDPEAGDLTSARMAAARELIDGAPRLLAPAEPIEPFFLQALTNHIDWADQPGQSEALLGGMVRQAIQARHVAELAASPPDERTIYWIQDTIDEADRDRRIAEDRLFIGANADTTEAVQLLAKVGRSSEEGLYGEAIATSKMVTGAFEERDRAWSDMRYLVAWALYRMHDGAKQAADQPGDQVRFQELMATLLNRGHELGVALDDGLPAERIDAIRQEVANAREEIMQDHRDTVRRLTYEASVDRQTKPQILRVLELPLFTGLHRNEMRRKLLAGLKPSEETIEKPQEILDAFKNLPAWEPADNDVVVTLASMAEHPTLTMVDPARIDMPDAVNWTLPRKVDPLSEEDAKSERARQTSIAALAEQGKELRNQLISAMQRSDGPGNLDRLYEITRKRLADEFQRSPREARRGVSTADRLTRAVGPLISQKLSASINNRGANPTLALRKTDRYFQCLWLADRTLNDFWGPARKNDSNYFEIVASDLLTSAGELLPEAAFRRYNDQPLPQKLAGLTAAAKSMLRLNGNPIGVSKGSTESLLSGSIQSNAYLPEGLAAIYLTSHGGHVYRIKTAGATKRRFGFRVGEVQKAESINNAIVHSSDDVDLGQQFSVVLKSFFRCHSPQTEIPVEGDDSQENTIVTRYEPLRQPEVLVQGDIRQIPSVLFVFDCSASMSRVVPQENNDLRMDIARARLLSILGKNPVTGKFRLPNDSFRIGFMMYGHRAGWERGGFINIRLNDDLIVGGINPRSLHPSLDVETVVPISRLNDRVRRDIQERLTLADPWGQTPLYYSIRKAIEQFSIDDAPVDAPREIIVLTDGEDDPGRLSNNQSTSANDVVKLLQQPQNKAIKVHIVAFDFRLSPELKSIAGASGGKFFEATKGSDLERTLDSLLSPITFNVQQLADNEQRKESAVPLGERWVVEDWSATQVERNAALGNYRVDVFGVERAPSNADNLQLLGGESLVMEYNQSERFNRLEHLQYKPPEFLFGDSRTTAVSPLGNDRQRKFLVTSWVPKRIGGVLQFDISIQHHEFWPFTPRPERVWVEIKPEGVSSGGRNAPVFNFFDHSIVQGKPVPVYRYTVQKWPDQSRSAEVRIWFLTDPLTPAYREKLPTNDADLELSNDGLRQQVPGSKFHAKIVGGTRTEPYRAYITETIGPGGDLYGTCVDIWPRPDKVEHNYQGNKATHEFMYNNAVNMSNPEVSIWSRKLIEQNAVRIEDIETNPMRVRVPEPRSE